MFVEAEHADPSDGDPGDGQSEEAGGERQAGYQPRERARYRGRESLYLSSWHSHWELVDIRAIEAVSHYTSLVGTLTES